MTTTTSLSVLLVEDDPAYRRLLQYALGFAGGFVVSGTASTPEDALAAVVDHAPDIVLLDLTLGSRLTTEILADLAAAAPGAMIVVLSSRRPQDFRGLTLDAGAFAFLSKTEVSMSRSGLPALLREMHERFRARPG